MTLNPCIFCGRRALGLHDQAYTLDSYYLQPGDDALAAEIYGWSHTSCLIASRWGRDWATYFMRHEIEVLHRPIIAETSHLVAFRYQQRQETTFIRRDGLLITMRDQERRRALSVAEGLLVPVQHEFNLNLPSNTQLVKHIQAMLLARGTYPLRDLLEALNLADTLVFPSAIEQGHLHFDRKLKQQWAAEWISAQARYSRFIPAEMLAVV